MSARRRTGWTIAALAAVWCAGSVRAAGGISADIGRLLERLPDARVTCSAEVVDLADGSTVYTLNASTPLIPASNQKLLVLATSLDMFDARSEFRTTLAIRGDDLILIGDGDPALGDPELAKERSIDPDAFLDDWVAALRAAGVTRVAGDLVVDATIFDEQFVNPDWEEGDLVKWYGAPIGGLNLNNNCIEMTVWPGSANGSDAVWSLHPPCSLVEVTNQCKSAPGRKSAEPLVGRKPGTFELVLRGSVAQRGTLQSISIPQPNLFAATAIREHLETGGIAIEGKLRFEQVRTMAGTMPEDCRLIAERNTPLTDVLQRIGQDSQNMCAESLMKRVGFEWAKSMGHARPIGSWDTGRAAVQAFLSKAGADVSHIVICDGSGLARTNRISASDFVHVLTYMHRHVGRDTFLASLAGNRTGGTLKRRMANVDGDVYAKTGYISGVRSLSGYVRSTAGRWYAFSIMFNGFRGSSSAYNRIHQQVCQILSHAQDASPP